MEVPLVMGAGDIDRQADHATVAMNSNRDILVAFHSHRNELGPPMSPGGIPNLKQVEVAFYEYKPNETWEWRETQLVGSVNYAPLIVLIPGVTTVSCERPDVKAVGNDFVVTWTRQYNAVSGGEAINEPVVLECAWIEINTASPPAMEITGAGPDALGAPQPGRGFELDIHHAFGTGTRYEARESLSTPDIVVLKDAALPAGQHKVAVVYSHQYKFSDPMIPDLKRTCESRVVTCTFAPSTDTITAAPPEVLHPSIKFNGINQSAGIILPDAAPSGEDNAFWMVAESQGIDASTVPPLVTGAIQLDYWELDTSGDWQSRASKTFFSPGSGAPYIRRRPMVSAYPEGTGAQTASVTFSKKDPDINGPDQSANVITKTFNYDNGSLIEVSPQQSPHEWPNTASLSDAKPTVIRGRKNPNEILYYFSDQLSATGDPNVLCKILAWDQVGDVMETLTEVLPTAGSVGRPAAAYFYEPNPGVGINGDYLTVGWEALNAAGELRPFLGVME